MAFFTTNGSVDAFQEARFKQQVENALVRIRGVLNNTRAPTFLADVPHQYQDKYVLAESVVKTGAAAILRALEALGLTAEGLQTLRGYAKDRVVQISFKSEERCTFLKKVVVEEDSKTKHVTEVRGMGGGGFNVSSKTVHTYTEYHWTIDVAYELLAHRGVSPDEGAVVLQSRAGKVNYVTRSETQPFPKVSVRDAMVADISWLLARVDADRTVAFAIDRADGRRCRTPRRNPDVDQAFAFLGAFYEWAGNVHGYFANHVFTMEKEHALDLRAINADTVFVPAVPLAEANAQDSASPGGDGVTVQAGGESDMVLGAGDANVFLNEQVRSLQEKLGELSAAFPADNGKLVTAAEARMLTVLLHLRSIVQHIGDGINSVEDMLRKGLVAAIGKEVTPADLASYMRFHNGRLFRPAAAPAPFSYVVRRPDHAPEGAIAIESREGGEGGSNLAQPVPTTVRRIDSAPPMQFALDASTNVTFNGARYLHAVVRHQFSTQAPAPLVLAARARQFSSFIMLVGKVATGKVFEPEAAIVIQNKDDLEIPLMLDTIPTPKEFRDAIESLSPEQQRFCKAYRSMQLASTLFGVLVLQIKPQLEKLLLLPEDSLTKEIKLSQNLQELFLKYQIPSDQLKHDQRGRPDDSDEAKVAYVRGRVDAIYAIIEQTKEEELAEQRRIAEMKRLENERINLEAVQSFGFGGRGGGGGGGGGGFFGSAQMLSDVPMGASSAFGGFAPQNASAMDASSLAFEAPVLGGQAQGGMGAMNPFDQASALPLELVAAPAPAPAKDAKDPAVVSTEVDGTLPPRGDDAVAQDVSLLPGILDAKYEALDEDSALRPTIISTGDTWKRRSCKTLLSKPEDHLLSTTDLENEKKKAFDLLDALSRSGALSFDDAELHVIVAATHGFDKTLMDTLVKDNVNPIEKIERSVLIAASAIHSLRPVDLVQEAQVERVSTYSPGLFLEQ